MELIPEHLKKYIVTQDYSQYTPVDHAVWRFILRQLRHFLSKHAHESYLDGLEKTGISIERIPSIHEISEKLKAFGWRALPVSGFIPPAAFMELQALGVLPIASDMRTLEHLEYTPAPDIVHEAAGHAPMLANQDYSNYLKQYAQVARKAIISREDLDLYEAIRNLSDIKEHPDSTPDQIQAAQQKLEQVSRSMSHVSEAAQLGRMNWWTAEYGLIGDLSQPRIFGAGLLSSVGESKWCLSEKVRKIPLSVQCIEQAYDITEPQPQLFVTPDFATLSRVLDEMANQMAFRLGGIKGMERALHARTVNTLEFNSGVQVSGQLAEILGANGDYFRMEGPSQICYRDHELPGQGRSTHAHGFSAPVGRWKSAPQTCPSLLSPDQLSAMGLRQGSEGRIEFLSGVVVEGTVSGLLFKDGKLSLISWTNCTVKGFGRKLFQPDWGAFDMPVGEKITSVFGGPADRAHYGGTEDFVAQRVPPKKITEAERKRHSNYQSLREAREGRLPLTEEQLLQLMEAHERQFPSDWLVFMEALELCRKSSRWPEAEARALKNLDKVGRTSEKLHSIIQEGVAIAAQ